MARAKTVGYIVVGGTNLPLRWFEAYSQFLCCGVSEVTLFERGRYEDARRHLGRHYRTMNEKWDSIKNSSAKDHLTNLRIVRLVGPGGGAPQENQKGEADGKA